ncbi:hypothetical protein LTR96_011449 [Exophiala xenobiotica]|nr:hypothetical protein LTR96_011449 [Exophiala xenobiotica]
MDVPSLHGGQKRNKHNSNGEPKPLRDGVYPMIYMNTLDGLFLQVLKTLGDLGRFKRLNAIRTFVVYAHDNSKAGAAHQHTVRNLIEWLRLARTNTLSDKWPILETLEALEPTAAADIVENQIRLLPTWKASTMTEGDINIDKVILCSSEVLRRYYESDYASSYIQKVEDLCVSKRPSPEAAGLTLKVKDVVASSCQDPGFHHVLTELAFLRIRSCCVTNDKHGIIPVDLEGNSMSYMFNSRQSPVFERSRLVLNYESATDPGYQHKRFFDLLGLLYPEQRDLILSFQKCYVELRERSRDFDGEEERLSLARRMLDDTVHIATQGAVSRYVELQSKLELMEDRRDECQHVSSKLDELDKAIRRRYDDGRLRIERLSRQSLPLGCCFINLAIIHHTRDSDTRSESDLTEPVSKFSLAARLKANVPVKSRQISLTTLFESQEQKDGTISRPKRVLIWGRAGMGKTTLCKKIVYEVYKNGLWKEIYDRVIWLPLRRLKKIHCRTTVELLKDEFPCPRLGERITEALDHLIQSERTLFLLDGLDEVSLSLEQDSSAERVLSELLSRPHTIITSRPHSTYMFDHQPPDLELETIGFFPQQIEEYLQQVTKETKTGDSTVQEIRSFLQRRPLIQSLASIPIQLDAICYTWNVKTFPRDNATMTSLYVAISQKLWKYSAHRMEKTYCGKPVTPQQLDLWQWSFFRLYIKDEVDFLQELAFRGLFEEVIEFSAEDIETLDTSLRMASDNIERLAFLRSSDDSVAADDRFFHFIHLTFQEFFAAQFFVFHWTSNMALSLYDRTGSGRLSNQSSHSMTPGEFVQSRKYVDRYDIFWRFVVGLLGVERNKEHLRRFLNKLESEPTDLLGLAHQRLVVHCLSELSAGDKDLGGHLRQLENRYLQWSTCETRLNRSWKGSYGRFSSTPLIEEAECSDYILRSLLDKEETELEVLDALFRRSSVSRYLTDTVIQKLRENTSEDARRMSIMIIGRHCGQDQKEIILNLFHNRQYYRITPRQIIDAWRHVSGLLDPVIEALVQLLQDPDKNVRSWAADALGGQATLPDMAIEALIQLLQYPDRYVRSRAVNALKRQTTLPDMAIEALVQLLQDPDRYVRSWVADALGGQATLPDIAIEALVQLLQDLDRYVRSEAVKALGRQTTLPDMAIEALVQLLQDPVRYIRSEAAKALGRQTTLPDIAIEALVQLLQDPDEDVRSRAAEALREQITLPNMAIEALVQLLQDPDKNVRYVRSEAVKALRRQTTLPDIAIEALVQLLQDPDEDLLQDPDEDVRSRAAEALGGQITLPDIAIEALIQLLQDPDEDVRSRAAEALGRQITLPDMAIEPLIQLLQDPDENVRSRAANTLREQTTLPDIAIEALVQLLQDPDKNVRSWAADALGGQATLPDMAIEALVQLLQYPDRYVRSEAAKALGRQTTLPDMAIEALIQLLQYPYWYVRSEAAKALGRQTTLPDMAIEALVQLLQDPDEDVRSRAAEALGGQITLPDMTIEALVQLLQDLDRYVRSKAVKALRGQATLPNMAIEALVQLLQDLDRYVRSEAVKALGRQATLPDIAIEALVQLLQDPDEDVRSEAANALRRQAILPDMAIEALVQLLQHPDEDVRSEAANALGRQAILPDMAIEALVQLLLQSGNSATEEAVNLITSRQEIRAWVPVFGSTVLQHLIKRWFRTASTICFFEKGCFCVIASEQIQRISLEPYQLECFRIQWQKARDDVGLPSFIPVFSTSG